MARQLLSPEIMYTPASDPQSPKSHDLLNTNQSRAPLGPITLHCPFTTSLNPHVEAAEQAGLEWARRFNLLNERRAGAGARLEYVRLSALCHPQAPLERLQIVADFVTWLFMLDDTRDESEEGHRPEEMAVWHRRFVEVLQGARPEPQDGRFTHALYDLRSRILQFGSGSVLPRFTRSVQVYFEAIEWEATNRSQGITPDSRTYVAMRPETSAVYPCFDLISVTDRLQLPDSVFQHDAVRRLSLLANRVVSFCNDIYSVNKERAHEDVHNLVIVLQREGRLSAREALHLAAHIHNQDVAEFLKQAARLPKFGPAINPELARYVEGLCTWIRANYEFSQTAARYQAAGAEPLE